MDIKNRAIQILRMVSWETTGLANPLFLILLSFASFFFMPSAVFGQYLISLYGKPDPFPVAAQDLFIHIADLAVQKLYVPLILIVSFSMTNTLTREFDSGLAKFYLSLPVGRSAILLGKLLANLLLIYVVEIFACLSHAYLLEPSNFLAYLSKVDSLAAMFLYTFSELFFIFGVTTWVCTLAQKSWVAVVLCTFSLYSFIIVRELASAPVNLPPFVFSPFLFSGITLLFLVASTVLLILSIYLFTRRTEVS